MTATTTNSNIFSDAYPEQQTAVRRRLDEIWAACAARDFDLLESFHGYGPKFTSFKDISDRISSIHKPDKLISKRIELELSNPSEKYHIFVAK